MINNGSTDNTEEVYREFCRENPEIRTTYVPVYPNQGPCHGWNMGLDHAHGKYVMLCDADDWGSIDIRYSNMDHTIFKRVEGRRKNI